MFGLAANVTTLDDATDFAYVYGTLPTAPTVFIFAKLYDIVPVPYARTL